MAVYTSTQSGDFEATRTWGGSGWPSLAGDRFIITAGHTVKVNQNHTHELGASIVNGTLEYNPTVNTGLRFGNATLTIGATGRLRIGTAATPINQSVIARLEWNPTSDNAVGLSVTSGGVVEVYGDPEFYGSDDDTFLYADWTSGQTIQVEGDFSSKWRIGQELYIHKGTNYSDWRTDVARVTIASTPVWDGVKTSITISEAFPGGTFFAGGMVVNASRNVVIGKLSPVLTIGNFNTNRPYITNNNSTSGKVTISNAMLVGLNRINNTAYTSFIMTVIRNGNIVASGGRFCSFNGCRIISMSDKFSSGYAYQLNNTMLIACSGWTFPASTTINGGEVYSNNLGISASNINIKGLYIYGNNQGFQCSNESVISAVVGYNKRGNVSTNGFDFNWGSGTKTVLNDTKLPLVISHTNRSLNGASATTKIVSQHHNQTKDAHYKYLTTADVIKNTSVLCPNGASSSIEVIPNSITALDYFASILGTWTEDNVPATQQTRSIKIKGEGWVTFPTSAQLYFEAEYFNQASGASTTTVQSTTVLTNNTDWFDFSVTFTPAQVGKVVYRAYIKTYAAGAKIYIDNALYRSGALPYFAIWSEGESHLQVDYKPANSFNVINGCHFIRRAA